jgi:hypothetical protein
MAKGPLADKIEVFRSRAAECERLANEVTDPDTRRILREAATNWRIIANRIERMGW